MNQNISEKQIVFICGMPRSGTSTINHLLNLHPHVMIGAERYFNVIQGAELTVQHLDEERYTTMCDGDTHSGTGFYQNDGKTDLGQLYRNAEVIGDKYPMMFRRYQHVLNVLPQAKFLYMLRNPLSVCESYEARASNEADNLWTRERGYQTALLEWNESVANTLRLAAQLPKEQLLIVEYEDIFQDKGRLQQLYEWCGTQFLDLEGIAPVMDYFQKLIVKPVPRNEMIRKYVSLNADWTTYHKLLQHSFNF